MKEYKIVIYSKKKIWIQLLYTYLREYIEKKKKKGECKKSIMIESRSSMEMMKTELYGENHILLFNFGSENEIADFKKMMNKKIGNDEGGNSYINVQNSENISKNREIYENVDSGKERGNKIENNHEENSNDKENSNHRDISDNKMIRSSEGANDKDRNDFRKMGSNREGAHILLLDNVYCNIKEKEFFQEYESLYFINDLEELTAILEGILCIEDNLEKSSDNLTRREKEILLLITKGKLNKEIANELNITERTVKNHIANLFKKINVYDRTQAAVYAIRNGIYHLYQEEL